jgi:branched-chain amino acid transport system permease protein
MSALTILALLLATGLVSQRITPRLYNRIGLGLLVVLLLSVPFYNSTPDTFFQIFTILAAAQGWNIIAGFTGYPNLGLAAFYGLGAFVAANLMSKLPGKPGLPWPLGLAGGMLVTVIFALVIGLVVLRFKGHYFTVVTFGIGLSMGPLIGGLDWLGNHGSIDFPLVPPLEIAGFSFGKPVIFYYAGVALIGAGLGLTAWINHSRFGFALQAIRENEEAAMVLGVNATYYKVGAFCLSALITSLAGALSAYQQRFVTTDQAGIFNISNTVDPVIICLLGGLGTVWGPVLGAFLLAGLKEVLQNSSADWVNWQPLVFSVIIILVVFFVPNGLIHFLRPRLNFTWRKLFRKTVENRA